MNAQTQALIQTLENAIVRQRNIIQVLLSYAVAPPEVEGLQALQALERMNVVPDGNDRKDKEVKKTTDKGTSS